MGPIIVIASFHHADHMSSKSKREIEKKNENV